jgi:serine/threonine protein kinase
MQESWEINVKEVEFQKVIGSGSCGKVWKGEWNGLPVAVKTFKASIFETTEKFIQAVEKEVQLMSSLHHPNIVMFLGASIVLPELCMLLEYCGHGCLMDFLVNDADHKIPITMDLCVKFDIDVARGVKYLHERCNIIQRYVRLFLFCYRCVFMFLS